MWEVGRLKTMLGSVAGRDSQVQKAGILWLPAAGEWLLLLMQMWTEGAQLQHPENWQAGTSLLRKSIWAWNICPLMRAEGVMVAGVSTSPDRNYCVRRFAACQGLRSGMLLSSPWTMTPCHPRGHQLHCERSTSSLTALESRMKGMGAQVVFLHILAGQRVGPWADRLNQT